MKKTGYIIITVAFLAGSLVAVIDEVNVQWIYFIAAIVIGTAGVAVVRLHEHRLAVANEKTAENLKSIDFSLAKIVENITSLNTQKQSINPYDIRQRIDELFNDDLTAFVQARHSLAHTYGLQAYADIMSHFASAQRYLNRVWSASADGYIDEVYAYLDRAQIQFSQALEKVRSLNQIISA